MLLFSTPVPVVDTDSELIIEVCSDLFFEIEIKTCIIDKLHLYSIKDKKYWHVAYIK